MTRAAEVFTVETCPLRSTHTPAPTGYLEWHAWAARMSMGHIQSKCHKCKTYSIWKVRGTKTVVTEPIDFPHPCLSCPRPAASAEG
jgi:hypothetical protein